jgi:ribosomal protein L11 methyltransferase
MYWSFDITRHQINIPSDTLSKEEIGGLCLALGADGFNELNDDVMRIFFSGTPASAENCCKTICDSLNITDPVELVLVEQINWVQKNNEVLTPIACECWEILPVAELPERPAQLTKYQLSVLPGMGFGTGHHTSTQLALSLIRYLEDIAINPLHIVDIGTGSGILAIAASKIWPASKIVATDIDEQALLNAQDLLFLNGTNTVSLYYGSLPNNNSEHFNIMIANLYAECLVDLQAGINQRANNQCFLVQSGILSDREMMVKNCYEKNWKLLRSLNRDQWCAFLWQKR